MTAGRYDNLHGDEPEIEAERSARAQARREWDEDHWEEFEDNNDDE